MKRLLLLFILLQPLWAEPIIAKQMVDVDADGLKEWVGLQTYEHQGVTLGQMVLIDGRGDVLWAGSKTAPQFIFLGEFDGGEIEAAYQTDDGQTFVVASYQKSDVRPTRFRLFTWHNRGFVHLRDGHLLASPSDARRFTWGDNLGAQSWLEGFDGTDKQGRLKARVTDLQARSKESVLLRPEGKDYLIE